MRSARRKWRGRRRPVNGPRNACAAFSAVGVLGGVAVLVLLLAVAYALPAVTYVSKQNMTDYFDGSTLIGKFMLNCTWIVLLMIGILIGTMHSWAKKEHVLQGGLEEWREWRGR